MTACFLNIEHADLYTIMKKYREFDNSWLRETVTRGNRRDEKSVDLRNKRLFNPEHSDYPKIIDTARKILADKNSWSRDLPRIFNCIHHASAESKEDVTLIESGIMNELKHIIQDKIISDIQDSIFYDENPERTIAAFISRQDRDYKLLYYSFNSNGKLCCHFDEKAVEFFRSHNVTAIELSGITDILESITEMALQLVCNEDNTFPEWLGSAETFGLNDIFTDPDDKKKHMATFLNAIMVLIAPEISALHGEEFVNISLLMQSLTHAVCKSSKDQLIDCYMRMHNGEGVMEEKEMEEKPFDISASMHGFENLDIDPATAESDVPSVKLAAGRLEPWISHIVETIANGHDAKPEMDGPSTIVQYNDKNLIVTPAACDGENTSLPLLSDILAQLPTEGNPTCIIPLAECNGSRRHWTFLVLHNGEWHFFDPKWRLPWVPFVCGPYNLTPLKNLLSDFYKREVPLTEHYLDIQGRLDDTYCGYHIAHAIGEIAERCFFGGEDIHNIEILPVGPDKLVEAFQKFYPHQDIKALSVSEDEDNSERLSPESAVENAENEGVLNPESPASFPAKDKDREETPKRPEILVIIDSEDAFEEEKHNIEVKVETPPGQSPGAADPFLFHPASPVIPADQHSIEIKPEFQDANGFNLADCLGWALLAATGAALFFIGSMALYSGLGALPGSFIATAGAWLLETVGMSGTAAIGVSAGVAAVGVSMAGYGAYRFFNEIRRDEGARLAAQVNNNPGI